MQPTELLILISAALVVYAYVLYPLVVAAWAKLRRRRDGARCPAPQSVSFLISARNEERRIEQRLRELLEILQIAKLDGEIILVSDGSTDATAEIVRRIGSPYLHLIEWPVSRGKSAAISAAAAMARNELLVFADVRQRWSGDALSRLVENFCDPRVGAVSGELVLESSPGVLAGVGLYWRYEKWLRQQESSAGCMIGVTGAIAAVRRDLFRQIPDGTLLDDVYWPAQVALQGYRVVYESRAQAFDRLPERTADEFRRKVRTLCGNYQLLMRMPRLIVPWRNPIWLQFLSHKLARLAVPWALLLLLIATALSPGWYNKAAFAAQAGFYSLAVAGIWRGGSLKIPLASAAASFVMLNAAAWLAFWVWMFGRAERAWTSVRYDRAAEMGQTSRHAVQSRLTN